MYVGQIAMQSLYIIYKLGLAITLIRVQGLLAIHVKIVAYYLLDYICSLLVQKM